MDDPGKLEVSTPALLYKVLRGSYQDVDICVMVRAGSNYVIVIEIVIDYAKMV